MIYPQNKNPILSHLFFLFSLSLTRLIRSLEGQRFPTLDALQPDDQSVHDFIRSV